MIKWFGRQRDVEGSRDAMTPAETAIWAVGDVHGRLDLLRPLVAKILEDFSRSQVANNILIFLGDYVDRGADSRGVLDFLCALEDGRVEDGAPYRVRFLRGNHEDRMEAFLRDPSVGPSWCDYGGRETLRSYGVAIPADRDDVEAWTKASEDFGGAVGSRHVAFLRSLEMSIELGDYFFSHAGARPGVALDAQSNHDLMWIRQAFLDDTTSFDRIIVHGHTPSQDLYSDHRRIGVDTGAYATSVLSAVRFEGSLRSVLQTSSTGSGLALSRRNIVARPKKTGLFARS